LPARRRSSCGRTQPTDNHHTLNSRTHHHRHARCPSRRCRTPACRHDRRYQLRPPLRSRQLRQLHGEVGPDRMVTFDDSVRSRDRRVSHRAPIAFGAVGRMADGFGSLHPAPPGNPRSRPGPNHALPHGRRIVRPRILVWHPGKTLPTLGGVDARHPLRSGKAWVRGGAMVFVEEADGFRCHRGRHDTITATRAMPLIPSPCRPNRRPRCAPVFVPWRPGGWQRNRPNSRCAQLNCARCTAISQGSKDPGFARRVRLRDQSRDGGCQAVVRRTAQTPLLGQVRRDHGAMCCQRV
jgi:hypothetical protein